MGGIQRQDAAFGVTQFQARGQYGFYEFLLYGALFLAAEADDLHSNGTAAAHHVAASEVLHKRAAHSHGVHAGMPPEMPVLKLDQCGGKTLRYGVAGREPPLPVLRNACAQEFAFGTLHHGGVHRVLEQVPGQAEEVGQKDYSQP